MPRFVGSAYPFENTGVMLCVFVSTEQWQSLQKFFVDIYDSMHTYLPQIVPRHVLTIQNNNTVVN